MIRGPDRIEPVTTYLQSRPGKTLNALSGVAYTEISEISALLIVPKLSRTRQLQAHFVRLQRVRCWRGGREAEGGGLDRPYSVVTETRCRDACSTQVFQLRGSEGIQLEDREITSLHIRLSGSS
jgi:hypothetical protein